LELFDDVYAAHAAVLQRLHNAKVASEQLSRVELH
jgi:hypothetical protein